MTESEKISVVVDIQSNGQTEVKEPITVVHFDEFMEMDDKMYNQMIGKIIENACKDLGHNLRSYFFIKRGNRDGFKEGGKHEQKNSRATK